MTAKTPQASPIHKHGRFIKGYKRPSNFGRKKGTPNKITTSVKQSFLVAFEDLGGIAGMVKWARKCNANRTEFYKLYAKLAPTEVKQGLISDEQAAALNTFADRLLEEAV